MKKTLLFSAAMLLGASAYAQTADLDMTPTRFQFANQEVGQVLINYYNSGVNPAASTPTAATEMADNGFVGCYVAPADGATNGTEPTTDMTRSLQANINIVDLGGEVGKVLCLKGPESTSEFGPAAANAGTLRFGEYDFYTKIAGAERQATVRTRLVYSIVSNTESYDDVFQPSFSTFTNNDSGNQTGYFDPSLYYAEEEGGVAYDDEGNPIYDGTKWQVFEFDATVGEVAGFPGRLRFHWLVDAYKTSCVLIKELKFTLNPTGELVQGEFLTYKPGTSSVKELVLGEDATFAVSGNQVTFSAAGNVYNISGMQVADAVAGETVTLDRGIYVVKAGDKTEKLIVK